MNNGVNGLVCLRWGKYVEVNIAIAYVPERNRPCIRNDVQHSNGSLPEELWQK